MNKESVEWKNWVGLKKKKDDTKEEPKKQEDTKEEPFQERIVEEVGKSNGSEELDEKVKVDKTTK